MTALGVSATTDTIAAGTKDDTKVKDGANKTIEKNLSAVDSLSKKLLLTSSLTLFYWIASEITQKECLTNPKHLLCDVFPYTTLGIAAASCFGTIIAIKKLFFDTYSESEKNSKNSSIEIKEKNMSITYRPNSLSSSLMMGVNLYRNNPGVLNKALAQIAYPFVTTAALVETVARAFFTILSSFTLPFTNIYFISSAEQLKSSLFTIIWSVADFLINPFCHTVVADENSAKLIAQTGNLFILPTEAIR